MSAKEDYDEMMTIFKSSLTLKEIALTTIGLENTLRSVSNEDGLSEQEVFCNLREVYQEIFDQNIFEY